ncbi:MAG: hypothetical protein AB1629_04130 [Candidatus Omnitrophota bacterium]
MRENTNKEFSPKCAATGIGSLPFIEPNQAVQDVFNFVGELPFWPQLPKRGIKEGMLFQFIGNLNFLTTDNQSISVRKDWDRQLEIFFERVIKKDLDYFAIGNEYAAGLIEFLNYLKNNAFTFKGRYLKGQVTGPFTLGSAIKALDGNSLLFDVQLLDALVCGLALKARWQVREFKKLSKDAIIFIDEPYLACFGSGFTPINRDDVVGVINKLIEQIEEPDCLIGLHCCSNTDWALLLETDIDIISFDAFSYFERFSLYPKELKRFLARGGAIAWGIIPTTEFNDKVTLTQIVDKFKKGLNILINKGLDKEEIIKKSLITPSCGMGSLGVDIAKGVLNLLKDTSDCLKKEFSLL